MKPRNKVLRVSLSKGVLSISIGIGTLKHAAERHPETWLPNTDKHNLVVRNAFKFARDVKIALEREEEDGTTPVHSLIDKAILAAWENGSEGLDFDAMEVLENAERALSGREQHEGR